MLVALAAAAIFGLTLVANLTAKDLWLGGEARVRPMVTSDGELVSVTESKVDVPLAWAPFLTSEQLGDVEVLKYHDYIRDMDV